MKKLCSFILALSIALTAFSFSSPASAAEINTDKNYKIVSSQLGLTLGFQSYANWDYVKLGTGTPVKFHQTSSGKYKIEMLQSNSSGYQYFTVNTTWLSPNKWYVYLDTESAADEWTLNTATKNGKQGYTLYNERTKGNLGSKHEFLNDRYWGYMFKEGEVWVLQEVQ
ncbi:hypothetical protein [Bacillus thuringiensis]|uniref:hypothetical protein n=1 Tax=Bacillus thuringiensis TaxID=1428 RepID=UPI002D7FC2B6|nr:hypothetical protein [Bacillus thuringiensis]MEB4817479.1 hypothetical protein [Bacillus thuringiensis]